MRTGRKRDVAIRVALLATAVLGCAADAARDGGDDYRDPYMDEPLPPSCRDTSTGPCETDGEPVDECASSSDCPDGRFCRADFEGDRTAFLCVDACVGTADEQAWCIDDAGCCNAEAQCSARGYCLLP